MSLAAVLLALSFTMYPAIEPVPGSTLTMESGGGERREMMAVYPQGDRRRRRPVRGPYWLFIIIHPPATEGHDGLGDDDGGRLHTQISAESTLASSSKSQVAAILVIVADVCLHEPDEMPLAEHQTLHAVAG